MRTWRIGISFHLDLCLRNDLLYDVHLWWLPWVRNLYLLVLKPKSRRQGELVLVVALTLIAKLCMESFKLGRKSSRPRTLPEVFAAADGMNNSSSSSSWFLCHERWICTWWGCADTQMHTTRVQGNRSTSPPCLQVDSLLRLLPLTSTCKVTRRLQLCCERT